MGKAKWLIAILLLALGYFILPRLWMIGSVTGYTVGSIMRKPKVTVYDIRLHDIGLKGATIDIVLDIYNPNSVSITFDRANFDIFMNDVKVGSGNIPHQLIIPPHSSKRVPSTTSISYGGTLGGTWEYVKSKIEGREVVMTIKGNVYIDVPVLGDITIPFSYSKKV